MHTDYTQAVRRARLVWASHPGIRQELDRWMWQLLEEFRQEQGWHRIPMGVGSDFSFTAATIRLARERGMRGQDAEDIAIQTMVDYFLSPEQGGSGSDWKRAYARYRFTGLSFGKFFLSAMRKRLDQTIPVYVNRNYRNRVYDSAVGRSRYVTPDRLDQDEDLLDFTNDPSTSTEERHKERDRVLAEINRELLWLPNGELLSLIFRLLCPRPFGYGKKTGPELAQTLNDMRVPTVKGGKTVKWTVSMANGFKDTIQQVARKYRKKYGLDWDALVSQ